MSNGQKPQQPPRPQPQQPPPTPAHPTPPERNKEVEPGPLRKRDVEPETPWPTR